MRFRYIWTNCSEVMSRVRKANCNSGREASTSWRLLGTPKGRWAGIGCAKIAIVIIKISETFFIASPLRLQEWVEGDFLADKSMPPDPSNKQIAQASVD